MNGLIQQFEVQMRGCWDNYVDEAEFIKVGGAVGYEAQSVG